MGAMTAEQQDYVIRVAEKLELRLCRHDRPLSGRGAIRAIDAACRLVRWRLQDCVTHPTVQSFFFACDYTKKSFGWRPLATAPTAQQLSFELVPTKPN
jgi:hypothetical protein